MARVTVDHQRCEGHAICALGAPELFDVDDDGRAVVLVPELTAELEKAALDAASTCPERAIAVHA
ncbi:ferredoxin [Sporichthya polymorpha]|uniref:ferredoxin n=1 Tax=Sporichthya polymorpha TaxID=35751 RepID=UPI000365D970|nr:ferredoxin [Sporichthya polymorpha]